MYEGLKIDFVQCKQVVYELLTLLNFLYAYTFHIIVQLLQNFLHHLLLVLPTLPLPLLPKKSLILHDQVW